MSTSSYAPAAPKQKTITIERTLDLPLDTVWKAWTEPESFKKWWGPEGYTCPDCTIDLRVGGKNLSSMMSANGEKIWSTGTYEEIIPQQRIVYGDSFADSKGNIVPASFYQMPGEWPPELQVTVTFEKAGDKTNMTLQHSGLPVEMADDCITGWQSSFDKLENNLG